MSMTTTDVAALQPATLLRNPHNDSVFSARHRVLSALSDDDFGLDTARAFVNSLLSSGDLVIASSGLVPSIPTCRSCGCTEDFACEDGCAWANSDQTLCTNCTGRKR